MWVAGTEDTRQIRTYRLLLQRKAPVFTGAQQGPEGVDLGGSQEELTITDFFNCLRQDLM